MFAPLDPFLERHHQRGAVFALTGRNPQSIRDQMLRSVIMVDRGVRVGLLGPERPLVVVGAGAAGVSSALRAAGDHGVKTLVLDRSSRAFAAQAGSTTRFVCPTQYDFPLAHWLKAKFPWEAPKMPLPWDADFASDIAARWRREVGLKANDTSRLDHPEFHFGISDLTLDGYKIDEPEKATDAADFMIKCAWLKGGSPETYSAGMVILATGFGHEVTTSPDVVPVNDPQPGQSQFRSPAFWGADELNNQTYRSTGLHRSKAHILISGGGDGGLQDILRTCFPDRSQSGRPAWQIFDDVFSRCSEQTKTEVFRSIQAAEDQAARSMQLAHENSEKDWIVRNLHKKHREVVAQLFEDDAEAKIIVANIDRNVLRWRPKNLHFVYGGESFTQSYALNRFLVLLLKWRFDHDEAWRSQRELERAAGKLDRTAWYAGLLGEAPWFFFRCNTSVTKVEGGTAHTCSNSAPACFGEEHMVTLADGTRIPAHIVLLRHGVVDDKGKRLRPEQDILPYFLPDF